MRARGIFLAGAALVTGCSLVYASDLDGAREIGSVPDSSSSNSSGSAEAGITDGGGGAPDADAEAGPPTGCATYLPPPKFCEDFDRDGGLAGWNIDIDGQGQASIQTLQAFSRPWAAEVTMDKQAGDCRYSRIQRTFDNIGPKPVTVSFWMRLQSPWPDGMTPFVIDLHGDTGYCAVLYYIGTTAGKATSAMVNVQSNTIADDVIDLNGFPSTDDWTEVTFHGTPLSGGGATFEITFKDPNGFSISNKHDFAQCPPWKTMTIHAGMHCDTRQGTSFYDDIRADWQ